MSRAGQETSSLLVHGNQRCTVGHIAQKLGVEDVDAERAHHTFACAARRRLLERRSSIPEHCQNSPLAPGGGEGRGEGEAATGRGPHPSPLPPGEGVRISPTDYLTDILGEIPGGKRTATPPGVAFLPLASERSVVSYHS